MSIITRRLHVRGRVQGVWFRASTKAKADELDLCGTVRNVPDGSVAIEVKGPADKVTEFISWCHHGPELARVDEVTIEQLDELDAHEFKIIR